MQSGNLKSYKWAAWDEIEFGLEYISLSEANTINNWWLNRTLLTYTQVIDGNSLAIFMRIGGTSTPLPQVYLGNLAIKRGKLLLEAIGRMHIDLTDVIMYWGCDNDGGGVIIRSVEDYIPKLELTYTDEATAASLMNSTEQITGNGCLDMSTTTAKNIVWYDTLTSEFTGIRMPWRLGFWAKWTGQTGATLLIAYHAQAGGLLLREDGKFYHFFSVYDQYEIDVDALTADTWYYIEQRYKYDGGPVWNMRVNGGTWSTAQQAFEYDLYSRNPYYMFRTAGTCTCYIVSIHAPVRGATLQRLRYVSACTMFQSTPPCEGRP
jgi:hypothetical protein